jgi:hypothetical protein
MIVKEYWEMKRREDEERGRMIVKEEEKIDWKGRKEREEEKRRV